MDPVRRERLPEHHPGAIMRAVRQAHGLSLAELAARTDYSAAQVSRYERGVTPLSDVAVLRRFARALAIPPQVFGLADKLHGLGTSRDDLAATVGLPSGTILVAGDRESVREDGEQVRRRQLLASLALTAATAATAQVPIPARAAGETVLGELLISAVRDAMLGLSPGPARVTVGGLREALAVALGDFRSCHYRRLASGLPQLISAGHLLTAQGDNAESNGMLAGVYTLTTRMLIKLDDQQLGWMAADRARILAIGSGDPLISAEAARNLAVLARKAGWYEQAMSIALTAAASPALRSSVPRLNAERGLLIQSAAYTAARAGDRDQMREMTDEAAAIAASMGGAVVLRDHGGGFTPATVGLHRISAENYAGDPDAAIAAAERITPASLPTTERRARYWTDTARAYSTWGRRQNAVDALLAAELEAPQEIHARPAVKDLVRGLLASGPTTAELRGLAVRCSITLDPCPACKSCGQYGARPRATRARRGGSTNAVLTNGL